MRNDLSPLITAGTLSGNNKSKEWITKKKEVVFMSSNDSDSSSINDDLLKAQRERRQQTHRQYRVLEGTRGLQLPTEVLVMMLGFLNRDQLEVMQLVSGRFKIIIDKYYKVYPLRRVQICKVESRKSGQMIVSMACFSEDRRPQNMLESNSDLHLWLRNCCIDTIKFTDFYFTDRLLEQLKAIDPQTLIINHCVFDYDRKSVRNNPLTHNHLIALFSIPAFRNCNGAIFAYTRFTSRYRPSLPFLLTLPLTTLVIDFDRYTCAGDELRPIVDWLNDEPSSISAGNDGGSDALPADQAMKVDGASPLARRPKTKTLSLRGIEFAEVQFDVLVEELRAKFLADETRARPFMLETDFYPATDFNDVEGAHRIRLHNTRTFEIFEVCGNDDEPATIQRMRCDSNGTVAR